MEGNIVVQTEQKAVVPKKPRTKKFDVKELQGLPGIAPVKVELADDTCTILFGIKLGQIIGTEPDAARCLEFTRGLDQQAKEKNVGKVIAARFDNGIFEAELMLNLGGVPGSSSHVKNAFDQLDGYLNGAAILHNGVVGTPASWKAKVKNIEVATGHY